MAWGCRHGRSSVKAVQNGGVEAQRCTSRASKQVEEFRPELLETALLIL